MKNLLHFYFTLILCTVILSVAAQNETMLTIGDQAPPLKYSKWIKGEPLQSFDGGQLFVVEFWATWCGPCKAAMPHLTELQKEYKGKATFIGVNVWESRNDGELYETNLPAIEKFVKGNDKNMVYSVIADNNNLDMANNWLKAAGIRGIPSTFVIKNNQIVWIGHPSLLDKKLPEILNKNFDLHTFKLEYEESSKKMDELSDKIQKARIPVQNALDAKDYEKAFELMEKAKKDVPSLVSGMDYLKFTTLLKDINEEQAMEFGAKWKGYFKGASAFILRIVSSTDSLKKSTYLWAAKEFQSSGSEFNAVTLNQLALCYAKSGNFKEAISNQQKAITEAKKALKEGKMIGTIMDYTIKEYEDALGKYKGKLVQ